MTLRFVGKKKKYQCMQSSKLRLLSGFSIMEILMAIGILGLTAAAGYQVFHTIEQNQYRAIQATQNVDKPIAAFNQFFAQYNSSQELSTAIEVLDLTPNIDPFTNSNRFRSDRIRVLFDPDSTDLGLDSNPGDLTANLTADYTFSDGNIAAGFGTTPLSLDPDVTSFIQEDYIASGSVTLPDRTTFDPNNDPISQTLKLFDMGGRQRGTWIGIAFINGDFYLRMRAGRGTVSENDNFSGSDRAIRSVELNEIPEFDGMQHDITWDIDTGSTADQTPGKIRLWIDNRKVIDSEATCTMDQCQLGLSGEAPSWAGGNAGSWGNGGDCGGLTEVPGGTDTYDGPQQFQNCNPWPTAAGTLSVFRDQLIDESAVPATDEPQITLPLTNLSIDDNAAIYYRVFAIPQESCKFTGGSSYQYTFDCFDDDDYDRLKTDIDNLMNTDDVPFFDIGMLDGAVCRVTAYDSATETLTLEENSGCPVSSASTDPTAASTVYFLPPRLVFYSSDFSLRFVQSVMESFADPMDRFGDTLATRQPSTF